MGLKTKRFFFKDFCNERAEILLEVCLMSVTVGGLSGGLHASAVCTPGRQPAILIGQGSLQRIRLQRSNVTYILI